VTERAAPAKAGGPRGARRARGVGELLEIERSATEVVEPIARMWRELATANRAVPLPPLDTALRDALSKIGRLLSVNAVAILLADEGGRELVARAAIGLSEEMSVGLGIRAGEGMAGQVLKTREPLVVGDLSAIHVVNPVLCASGLRSVVAVPMLSGSHPLGVMWAGSYEGDHFTDADADLLQVVAERLAVELDRARELEREWLARLDAERLARRVARIQRATAELAATHSFGDVADAIVRVLEAEVPLWRAVWLSRDDRLDLLAQSGDPPPGWDAAVGPGNDAALSAVVRSRAAGFGVASDGGRGEGSWAVLPILPRHGPLGALAVVSGRTDWFTHDERSLLSLVVGQAEQAFERAHLAAAARQAADRASFFARAAKVLAEADDLAETLDRLAELAVSAIGEICLIDVIAEDGHLGRMAAKHRDPDLQPLVARLRTEFPPDPRGAHPAVRSISSGEATWSEVVSDEFLRATTVNDEHFQVVLSLGFRSYLTVPLVASGRVVGSFTCVSTSRPFHREDVSFTEELANHVASVVDNARRYETVYRTSHILQSSLLPARLPEVAGVSVETRYLTANRGLEVGGDFYDVLSLPTSGVLFMVGDVAGHDRAAAAQMGHLRSAARALAGQAAGPSALISALRVAWRLLGFERVATAAIGLLDPSSGALAVASAGHYPPLLVTSAGACFLPLVPGPLLGIDAPPAAEWHGTLEEGQVLLGYTDGAIDERSAGSERSMAILARVASEGAVTPVAVCDRVVAAIASDRADDVALMAVAIRPR
jgi:GAF domain-containing protein